MLQYENQKLKLSYFYCFFEKLVERYLKFIRFKFYCKLCGAMSPLPRCCRDSLTYYISLRIKIWERPGSIEGDTTMTKYFCGVRLYIGLLPQKKLRFEVPWSSIFPKVFVYFLTTVLEYYQFG